MDGDSEMNDSQRANRTLILSRLKDFQHVQLATVDGAEPRVGPVTLIYDAEAVGYDRHGEC